MFTASLVELAYNQLLNLGEDLEKFARHAKRKTVTPEDMFLACRRNTDLQGLLGDFWREMNKDIRQHNALAEENNAEKPDVVKTEDNYDDGDDDDVFGDSEEEEELLRAAEMKRKR